MSCMWKGSCNGKEDLEDGWKAWQKRQEDWTHDRALRTLRKIFQINPRQEKDLGTFTTLLSFLPFSLLIILHKIYQFWNNHCLIQRLDRKRILQRHYHRSMQISTMVTRLLSSFRWGNDLLCQIYTPFERCLVAKNFSFFVARLHVDRNEGRAVVQDGC